jgi:hypothetical protein
MEGRMRQPVLLACLLAGLLLVSSETRGGEAEPGGEEVAAARGYLLETSAPGYTMTLQGPEKALACLHPDFVVRLAAAIKDAREQGLGEVGVFSACRPPALGVGGFRDKFNSLHAYGMAVDLKGIGAPGSQEAKAWHALARRHGIVCPYGPNNRAEWNHCQPTKLRMVRKRTPLRETITADGPIDVGETWRIAGLLIVSLPEALSFKVAEAAPRKSKRNAKGKKRHRHGWGRGKRRHRR